MKKFIVNMWNEKKGVVIGVIIGLVVVISAVTIFVVDSSVKKQAKSDVLADKSEVISQTETVAKDEKSVTTSNNQTTTENETTESVATVQETQEDSNESSTEVSNSHGGEGYLEVANSNNNDAQVSSVTISETQPTETQQTEAKTEETTTKKALRGSNGVITTDLIAYTNATQGTFKVPNTISGVLEVLRIKDPYATDPNSNCIRVHENVTLDGDLFHDGIILGKSTIEDVFEVYGPECFTDPYEDYIYKYYDLGNEEEQVYVSFGVVNGVVSRIDIGNYKMVTHTA